MGSVDNGGLAPEAKYRELQKGPWKEAYANKEYKTLSAAEIYGIDEAYAKFSTDRDEKQAAYLAREKQYAKEKQQQKAKK